MHTIQFGYILPPAPKAPSQRADYLTHLHRALTLISGRFDSIYSIDHLEPDTLESFTALAYLAGQYPQFNIGHTVICQSFRNPALIAKMGATLQLLSGGRFLFGIGTGWNEPEYRAFGYDFPSAGVRVRQLEEALQIIQPLWRGEKVTFSGEYYRVFEAECGPTPDPIPPTMIGAFQPKMLRLAARYADEWNVSSTRHDRYQRLAADFDRACQAVGRDPSAVRRSWGGGCSCAPTQAQAERHNRSDNSEGDFDLVGTPERVIEHIQGFIRLGVTSFMVDCGGFPDLTTLELLVKEVLPVIIRTSPSVSPPGGEGCL